MTMVRDSFLITLSNSLDIFENFTNIHDQIREFAFQDFPSERFIIRTPDIPPYIRKNLIIKQKKITEFVPFE